MWVLFVGLSILAGDVLSQADSKTDILELSSNQLVHSNADLIGAEGQLVHSNVDLIGAEGHFVEYPFGSRLPRFKDSFSALSWPVEQIAVQENKKLGENKSDSTKNVIYLSNLNLPIINKLMQRKKSNHFDLPKENTEFVPAKEIDQDLFAKEVLKLPSSNNISAYIPPKESIKSATPEEIVDHLSAKDALNLLHSKNLSQYIVPTEISEYLPPNFPDTNIAEYLPPNEIPEYLPPNEIPEYLPPKEINEYIPPKEINEYIPPKEINEYIPPKEINEYLPPQNEDHASENKISTKIILPNPPEIIKKDSTETLSLFIKESTPTTSEIIPNESTYTIYLQPPTLNFIPPQNTDSSEIGEECKENENIQESSYLSYKNDDNKILVSKTKPISLSTHSKVKEKHIKPKTKNFKPLAIETSNTENILPREKILSISPYVISEKIFNEPIFRKSKPSLVKPYSIVEDKSNQVKSKPVDSSSPYGFIKNKVHPYQLQTAEYSPQSVTNDIISQPYITQSLNYETPIALSTTSEKSHYKVKGYSCLSNQECMSNEICQDGHCILGCTIAGGLCIGEAKCETRNHIPACICPPMFTARTITGYGYMQYDCMPMMMNLIPAASNTVFSVTGRQPSTQNNFRPFAQSRPVAGPIRTPIASFPNRIQHGSFVIRDDHVRPPALGPIGSGNACNPTPCGPNTQCSVNSNGIALCRCIRDYVPDGNTINGCKPQCVVDDECPDDYNCRRQKCERVCAPGACGINANCDARNHRAYCSCPGGFITRGDSCIPQPPVYDEPEHLDIDLCNPSPCGTEANCIVRGERPVCSCPRGYEGDPLTRCIRGECIRHEDCQGHLACQNLRCIDPCVGTCGSQSECNVRNHQPICSCPRNYIGDPFVNCRAITEYDICNPTPCGLNTNCKVRHDRSGSMRAVCSCIDNYIGSPLSECRPECVRDSDCSSNQHCIDNRCRNPCIDGCGEGAYCDVRNHRAVCTCPQFFSGDAHSRCYPECTKHDDCPDYQACYQFKCIDPCRGACGTGAECKVDDHTPICSCPRGYTGDPFVSCRPFTLADLCADDPCGTNAECHPGKDRSGNDRPVCVCPKGYIGNPLVHCERGECQDHNQCPDHQACYAYTCQSPCYTDKGSVCGENSHCRVKNHTPVCSCPRGYTGNPLSECRIAPNARTPRRFAGQHRLQKRK